MLNAFRITYKSSAEIDGGSAINSGSDGASFGTNCCSATCFSSSCCFWWAADETCNFCTLAGKVDATSSENSNKKQKNLHAEFKSYDFHRFFDSLTFPFTKFIDLVLIVRVVWITWIQEIKLWIAQFILSDSSFKFGSISGNEASSFINDVYFKRLRKMYFKVYLFKKNERK